MTRALGSLLLALAVTTISGTAAVAASEEAGKLICATVEARDYVRGEDCFRGLAEDVGAPEFFRVDLDGKVIQGPERITPIASMETIDGQLLQGKEPGFAWVIALDRANGRFSGARTSVGGAFVVFGNRRPSVSGDTGMCGVPFAILSVGWFG
jgi:hypothetical protein